MRHLQTMYGRAFASLVLLGGLLGDPGFASAAPASDGCADIEPAAVGLAVRAWDADTARRRYTLDGPGVLTLESGGTEEVALAVRPCGDTGEGIVLETSPTHLAVAVPEAGEWLVELSAPQVLPRVKLTADFTAARLVAVPLDAAGTSLAALVPPALAAGLVSKMEEEREADPDPATPPPPPPPPPPESLTASFAPLEGAHFRLLVAGTSAEMPLLAGLGGRCQAGPEDDYADTFACAAAIDLGRPAAGELRNAWGDDEDVFRFVLDEARDVRLAVTGVAAAVLHDRFGRPLGEIGDAVRPLRAGTYFVRIRGEGSYVVLAE